LKATVERTPDSEAVLTVTLEWAELEKASDRAYKRLAQKYSVPGFRKGNAPRSMLERMLGKDAIYQEGLEDLIESSYRDAIREHDLTPVAQPTLDAPPIEHDQPYSYTARVAILTRPTLGDYTSIRVAAPSADVTDGEVEHALEHMREDAAAWVPIERTAQVDDQVTVDLKLTVDDKVVSNYPDHEFVLAVERPGIFAGLDDHLVGMREGQSAQFETTIPEDYANTALAGKIGHYDITMKAVKVRELPELDDEFAKTVKRMGEIDSLEGLRAAVRAQLERQKESESRRELREQVVKAVADQAEVVIHPAMVSDEVDAMLRETSRVLGQNRLTLEQYLQIMQKSEEDYRAEIEPEARERVKRDLVIDAVADAEGIQVGDQDVRDWLQLYSILGNKPTRLQDLSAGQRANIASRLRRDKALNRLIEIATEGAHGGEETPTEPTDADERAGVAHDRATEATEAAESGDTGQATIRGAQEAARLGAALGKGPSTPSTDKTDKADKADERGGESLRGNSTDNPQIPNSSGTQALTGSGTEVPKSGR
jgi:trigger factor